jgi:hypothetical protein
LPANNIKKRGQGRVVQVGTISLTPQQPLPSGPQRPQTIFLRSDAPFTGEGQHVSLTAEPDMTQRPWLAVPFRFVVPPIDAWRRTVAHVWSPLTVFNEEDTGQERIRSAGPQLRTVSFRTMFLDYLPSWAVFTGGALEPILAVRELEQLCLRGIIFRLKIRNRGLFNHDDVNMLAVLESCEVSEQASEPETRYLDLSFHEFEPTELERKQQAGAGPWTHTIRAGDTLYSLARTYYRQQSLWPLIASGTSKLEGWAPSRDLVEWSALHKKMRLKVPAKPSAGTHVLVSHSANVSSGEIVVG